MYRILLLIFLAQSGQGPDTSWMAVTHNQMACSEDLKRAAAKVKEYVDNHVAHTTAAPVDPKITLQLADVHEAMKTVDRLFRRYHGLFTCSTFITTTPVEQDDFFAVFRVPWARPGYQPE